MSLTKLLLAGIIKLFLSRESVKGRENRQPFYSVEMYEREVILGSDDGKISVLSEDLYLEKQWTAHKGSHTDKGFESSDIRARLQSTSTLFQKVTLHYLTSNEINIQFPLGLWSKPYCCRRG
jgi:hypothetical protein